jgi:hypothetical protein
MEILLVLEGDLFRVVKGPGEGDLLLVHETPFRPRRTILVLRGEGDPADEISGLP